VKIKITFLEFFALQDRIRNLVYKIAERHLSTMKAGRFEYFPEHQFVQYVLPCFVLHFLFLCKRKHPAAGTTDKQRYMYLVEKFISSYEQHEYVQVLSIEKKAAIQIQRDASIISCHEFSKPEVMHNLLQSYLRNEEVFKDFSDIMLNFRQVYEGELQILLRQPLDCTFNWFLRITMFIYRAFKTICDVSMLLCDEHVRNICSISYNINKAKNPLDKYMRKQYTVYLTTRGKKVQVLAVVLT
jgi:hypothetical protein